MITRKTYLASDPKRIGGYFRVLFIGMLVMFLALPMILLFWQNLTWQTFQLVWFEVDFTTLLFNSTTMIFAVALVAVPLGTAVGYWMQSPNVGGRAALIVGVLTCLFVPLPVWAVSWQIIFGEWLPPSSLEPGDVAWRPWKLGLLPAAWIHAMAALPWVVGITWLSLQTTNPALEEEALQTAGGRGVFHWVMLPRLTWTMIVSTVVVAVQVGTEISVTDAMMVRTFAEEVYTQMVVRNSGLGGAIAATVPVWLGTALILGIVAMRSSRHLRIPPDSIRVAPRLTRVRSTRATLLIWFPFVIYFGLPLGALIWKAAGGGVQQPSFWEFGQRLEKVFRTEWATLIDSLASAAITGVVTTSLAWIACALGFGSARYRAVLVGLGLLLLALPGPLLGFAIKQATLELVLAERSLLQTCNLSPEFPPLRSLLYDQPSPIPGIWVCVLRFFPLACGIMAIVMQQVPKSLLETAAVEGRSAFSPWRWVIARLTARAFLFSILAIAALAFGEVSASKLAQPPARGVFILRLFDQMHYGAESTVAAFCLLQLATTWGIICLLARLKPE